MGNSSDNKVPPHYFRQSGVVPYRVAGDGKKAAIEVLLVTRNSGKGWTIPKGVVEPELSPLESAVKESEEEAGALGRSHPEAIGTYKQEKWGGTCTIEVFLLAVDKLLDDYDDRDCRKRRWCSIDDASQRVKQDELGELIRALPKLVRARGL